MAVKTLNIKFITQNSSSLPRLSVHDIHSLTRHSLLHKSKQYLLIIQKHFKN